jgi:hypothetical protein
VARAVGTAAADRRLELVFEFGDEPGARRIAIDPGKEWQARRAMIATDA